MIPTPTHDELAALILRLEHQRKEWRANLDEGRRLDLEICALQCLLLSLDHIFNTEVSK